MEHAVSRPDPKELPDSGADLFGHSEPAIVMCTALILVIAISVIDKMTGYDLRLTVVNVVPIVMMTWAAGRAWGMLLSVATISVWVAMFRGSHHYASNFYHYLEGAILLAAFGTVVVLLRRVRESVRNADLRFAETLECIDGAAYVADLARGMVLYGNHCFREKFAGWPFDKLEQAYQTGVHARGRELFWSDGRPVVLRILPTSVLIAVSLRPASGGNAHGGH